MTAYYDLLDTIKTIALAHPLVNTVTQGNADKIDLDKKNIYPLVHIETTGSVIQSEIVTFTVQLYCMDIRDTINAVNTDKFTKNDNEIDNLNTTHAILNKLYKVLGNQDDSFDIVGDGSCDQFTLDRANTLDGWVMTLTFELDNIEVDKC